MVFLSIYIVTKIKVASQIAETLLTYFFSFIFQKGIRGYTSYKYIMLVRPSRVVVVREVVGLGVL